jgi:hypothetical protein
MPGIENPRKAFMYFLQSDLRFLVLKEIDKIQLTAVSKVNIKCLSIGNRCKEEIRLSHYSVVSYFRAWIDIQIRDFLIGQRSFFLPIIYPVN